MFHITKVPTWIYRTANAVCRSSRHCSQLVPNNIDHDSDKNQLDARQDISSQEREAEFLSDFEQLDSSQDILNQPLDVEFPSDLDQYQNWYRDQSRHAYRPKVDPTETTIVLFPGQGSHYVGMGRRLLTFPNVKDLYEYASDILGYDLLKLCLEGPKSELDKTINCQPAVFVASLAALEKLSEEHPQAIENCVSTAGFSVGEYAALVFAGVLSFEDALNIVKIRAELMQEASEEVDSGMMTAFVTHNSKLKFACFAAKEYCRLKLDISNPVCTIANYLYSDAKVIAGHTKALEFIKQHAASFHLKGLKILPVSRAFHTEIMKESAVSFKEVLRDVKFKEPTIPVYSNVTSHKYRKKSDTIRLLSEHIYKPVKWEQTLHVLYSRPQGEKFPTTYELGPGKQLGQILRKVNSKAYESYKSIDV